MAEPFFTLDDTCPDAAGVVVPPALDLGPLIAGCGIRPAPEPIYQCEPPVIPYPGNIGSVLLLIRVTARDGRKHSWEAGDYDAAGRFVANGLTGSPATHDEAVEMHGAGVDPGDDVYLAKKEDGSDRLVFSATDVLKYIKLTAGPDEDGLYDWKEVLPPDWHDGTVTGKAADDEGAFEQTGFNPILDETIYLSRRTKDGAYAFLAPRLTYYVRLKAVDSDQKYDWAAYAPDGDGKLVATGFEGKAADKVPAYEPTGQVVPADDLKVYLARQDGKGKMAFLAPQQPFWVRLTGRPSPGAEYDWAEVEDDGDGNWAATGVVGTVAGKDGAVENQGLPAIPGDGKVYVARRTKKGVVRFSTTSANAGFLLLPPAGGAGVPPGSATGCGSASCEIIKVDDDGTKSASGITATVWNPYPAPAGVNASMTKPLQAKIAAGKLVVDVDPCGGT